VFVQSTHSLLQQLGCCRSYIVRVACIGRVGWFVSAGMSSSVSAEARSCCCLADVGSCLAANV
jgi:hypothetical protein